MSEDATQTSPTGFIVIDQANKVLRSNISAYKLFGIQEGKSFEACVHVDDQLRLRSFLQSNNDQLECIFVSAGSQKIALITKGIDNRSFWIQDLSQQKALEQRIQSALAPSKRLVRDLRHLTNTAMSYGELVQLILDDSLPVTSKVKTSISTYQSQLMKHLRAAVDLINEQKTSVASERKHILIVDDELMITELLTELMRAKFFKVTSFTNAFSAIEAFKINPTKFDLAILDHQMPELDGLELAQNLRRSNPKIPIIMCTSQIGFSSPKILQAVILKPIDIELLLTSITKILV